MASVPKLRPDGASAAVASLSTEERVTRAIRDAIVRGELAPGTRLNQGELAAMLGVGHVPLRDSLRRLEAESLVRVAGRKGVFVVALARSDIAEIYELRLLLEPVCASRAVETLTDTDVAALVVMSQDMDLHREAAVDGGEARRRFYQQLYSYAHRPRMAQTISRLRDNVDRYHVLTDRRHSQEAHEELRRCIRDRDPDAAAAVIRRHLTEARDDLLASLDGWDDTEPSP